MPDACAAVCTSLIWDSEVGFPGLVSKPITLALGTSSRSTPNRFAPSVLTINVTPVTLPPGRLRLETRPRSTGSAPVANTIGMVVVAALAATAADGPHSRPPGPREMNQPGTGKTLLFPVRKHEHADESAEPHRRQRQREMSKQLEADRVRLQAVEADGKNLDRDDEGLDQRALALFRQPAQLAPYDHERARHGGEASERAPREPDDGKGGHGSGASRRGRRPP